VVRRRTILCALVASAALLAIASALAGARAGEQTRSYRYTGVAENGRGAPTHLAWAGEGFAFSFYDALSRGRPSEPYKVCVGRSGKAPVKCWNRSARFGVGRLNLGQTLPSKVPFGELTVRWSLGGRPVARWVLLYARGGR
jgi:hypothetical protein